MTSWLKTVLETSLTKLKEPAISVLIKEFDELEQTPPAPGRPDLQHDTMVKKGLCASACKYPRRNRYCNQYPFESHLVRVPGVDYINASWIQMPFRDAPKYIITIAPMKKGDLGGFPCEDTRTDFWKMVWHSGASVITMLCQIQSGFTGCSEYFPDEVGSFVTFGALTISLENENVTEDRVSCIRLLKLTNSESMETRTVKHHQYLKWPNYGLPKDINSLASFIKEIFDDVSHEKASAGECQLLVHCSGGLGRSGTFMTIFMAYQYLLGDLKQDDTEVRSFFISDKNEINLFNVVKTMREQRHPWMVEGEGQYHVAYETVVELIKREVESRNS